MERKSIHNRYDKTRANKAKEQSQLEPVAVSKVLAYVNEFLDFIKLNNGAPKTVCVRTIELDNANHLILDNAIIAVGYNWTIPVYDTWYNMGQRAYAGAAIEDLRNDSFDIFREQAVKSKRMDEPDIQVSND